MQHTQFQAVQGPFLHPCAALLQDAEDSNEDKCHYFVKTALQPLVEVLLGQLTKQEEGQDLDDNIWNVSMASGTALSLVAQTVRDDVVPLAMPYVQVHARASTL
jgi:importin subunit beta-1